MPIGRDEVVGAALRLLDEYGLADLSMRRVADLLGVKAGALYWHVPSKQGLLAAVCDRVLGEASPPTGGGRDALLLWARTLREVLLGHRDSADLVATALASGLGEVDPTRGLAGVLEARLGRVHARWAAQALLHLVLGHVAHEQNLALFQQLAATGPGPSPRDDEGFDYAVGALLDGLLGSAARTD